MYSTKDCQNKRTILFSKIDKNAIEFLKKTSRKKKNKNRICTLPQGTETDNTSTCSASSNFNHSDTLEVQDVHSITTVCAVLSPSLVNTIPYQEIEQVTKSYDVKLERVKEACTIIGTWKCVQDVKAKLDLVYEEKQQLQKCHLKVKDERSDEFKPNEQVCVEENQLPDKIKPLVVLDNSTSYQESEESASMSLNNGQSKDIGIALLTCLDTDKYDGRNMIEIAPNRGQAHRVLGKNPVLAVEICEYCGYRSTKDGVIRHKQRRHSRVGYQCQVCNSVFGVRYDMRRHRLNHFDKEGNLNKKGRRLWIEHHDGRDVDTIHYSQFEENFVNNETETDSKSHDQSPLPVTDRQEAAVNEVITKSNQVKGEKTAKEKQKLKSRYPPKDTKTADCPICQKNYPLRVLPVHMKIHRKKEVIPCYYCAKVFKERGKLNAHINHAHEKRFKCETCQITLSTSSGLKAHFFAKHGLKFECQLCLNKTVFTSASSMEHHYKHQHSGAEVYFCSFCGKPFFNKKSLESHSFTHLSYDEKEALKIFHCPYCTKRFFTRSNLKMHENTHTGKKPYQCSVEGCGKSFSYNSMLNKHKKVHSSEKNYKCTYCTKGFKFPYKLRHHMIIHTRERVNCCDLCGKIFTTSTSLKLHNCRCRQYSDISPATVNDVEVVVVTDEYKPESPPKISNATFEMQDTIYITTEEQTMSSNNSTENPTIYVCGFCEQAFDNVNVINEHIQECHSSMGVQFVTHESSDVTNTYTEEYQTTSEQLTMHEANNEQFKADANYDQFAQETNKEEFVQETL